MICCDVRHQIWVIGLITDAFVSDKHSKKSSGTTVKDVLQDKPMQIVYPDSSHTQLLIREESLRELVKIEDEIAVVAVVGPFHSGKSYLLNQLMDRPSGFQIGATVEPTTMVCFRWQYEFTFQINY